MQQPNSSQLRWNVGGGDRQNREPFLLVSAGGVLCALPLDEVGEVLRPLAITQVAGAPPEVDGVAVVRGRSVPVLGLARLFDAGRLDRDGIDPRIEEGEIGEGEDAGDPRPGRRRASRWVTLRNPKAPVLAVDAVDQVRWLNVEELDRADLLSEAAAGALGRLGTLDRQILVCLETTRIVQAVDLPSPSATPGESATEASP